MYIAKKLRERRIEMSLKQRELAEFLGVTSQQIFKYDSSMPTLFFRQCNKFKLRLKRLHLQ